MDEKPEALRVRTYGSTGPLVIVLHGGPGAAGEAGGLAEGLADSFRVLEPWQRSSGDKPLTVATHVEDLHRIVVSHERNAIPTPAEPDTPRGTADEASSGSERRATNGSRNPSFHPALVGQSWGAMLALAYAAAHPRSVGPIVLVGCGTFDKTSRAQLEATLEDRLDEELRRSIECLAEKYPDVAERFIKTHELMEPLYAFDPIPPAEISGLGDRSLVFTVDDPSSVRSRSGTGSAGQKTGDLGDRFDVRAYEETWADMLRLQEEGVYPAAFSRISSPVLMLHGTYDPHPGRMIRDGLLPHLPQLEYREFERCGHQPWLERGVREEFFAVLKEWLGRPPTSSRR